MIPGPARPSDIRSRTLKRRVLLPLVRQPQQLPGSRMRLFLQIRPPFELTPAQKISSLDSDDSIRRPNSPGLAGLPGAVPWHQRLFPGWREAGIASQCLEGHLSSDQEDTLGSGTWRSWGWPGSREELFEFNHLLSLQCAKHYCKCYVWGAGRVCNKYIFLTAAL